MSLRIFLLTISVLLTFPAMALSFQGYVQPVGEGGTITWGNGEVSVVRSLEVPEGDENAKLTPLSVRRAASSARKQMLDMILAVRIDAKRTVSAFLSDDDDLAARVRGVVQNSPMERPALFEDGGEVRVSEQFRGKLAELILPTTIQFQSGIPPKLSTSMEQSLSYNGEDPEQVGGDNSSYTGVIIDARGLQVTPALTPVIYGQDGVGAYGAFLVSRANAINKGVIAYANTADPAALRERVGNKPLTIKALNAFGSWRTDLIITSPMAGLVRAIMRSPEAVQNCRVVIVLDRPEPVEEIPLDDVPMDDAGEQPEEGQTPAEEQ